MLLLSGGVHNYEGHPLRSMLSLTNYTTVELHVHHVSIRGGWGGGGGGAFRSESTLYFLKFC